ncbi:TRAP transporter small permease [Methylopila henanensis]|uniref:TRAP transporter small permease protein n=1 Tax=Methylopila henanensis TaxID=873516 RepID=A0ABW4KD16_9HYPH
MTAAAGSRAAGSALSAVRAVDRAVLGVNRAFMIAALAAMAVMVFVSVSLRYLTDDAILWAEELSRYLMIWLCLIGVGPVLRLGGHVAVDNLHVAVPPAAARALRVVVVAIVAGFALYMVWAGLGYVARSWRQTTPVLHIPFAYVAMAVPVGFGLSVWHLLMILVPYVRDGAFEASEDLDPEEASAA